MNTKSRIYTVFLVITLMSIALFATYNAVETTFSGVEVNVPKYHDTTLAWSYIIDANSTHTFAYNGTTWGLEYSGTNALTIFNTVTGCIRSTGGRVFIRSAEYDFGAGTWQISFNEGKSQYYIGESIGSKDFGAGGQWWGGVLIRGTGTKLVDVTNTSWTYASGQDAHYLHFENMEFFHDATNPSDITLDLRYSTFSLIRVGMAGLSGDKKGTALVTGPNGETGSPSVIEGVSIAYYQNACMFNLDHLVIDGLRSNHILDYGYVFNHTAPWGQFGRMSLGCGSEYATIRPFYFVELNRTLTLVDVSIEGNLNNPHTYPLFTMESNPPNRAYVNVIGFDVKVHESVVVTNSPERVRVFASSKDLVTHIHQTADWIISNDWAWNSYVSAQRYDTGINHYRSTNSSAVIMDVIANCTGGESIFIKDGNYSIDATITDQNINDIQITLEKGAVLTLADNVDDCMFTLTDVSGWRFYGGELDGNKGSNTGLSHAFRIEECSDMKIQEMYIHDFERFAVQTLGSASENTTWTEISGLVCVNNGWNGITIDQYSSWINCHSNFVNGSSDVGIGTYANAGNVWHVQIVNNIVDNCLGTDGAVNSQWGITIEAGIDVLVALNTITRCRRGISQTTALDAECDHTYQSNEISRLVNYSTTHGIYIVEHNTKVISNDINMDGIDNPSAWGIRVWDVNNSIIQSNWITCDGARTNGIVLFNSSHNLVSDNHIIFDSSSGNGIYLHDDGGATEGNSILDNHVRDFTDAIWNTAGTTLNWIDGNNFYGSTDASGGTGTPVWGDNINEAGALVSGSAP